MKKTILALFMTGLMVATIFGACSCVSASTKSVSKKVTPTNNNIGSIMVNFEMKNVPDEIIETYGVVHVLHWDITELWWYTYGDDKHIEQDSEGNYFVEFTELPVPGLYMISLPSAELDDLGYRVTYLYFPWRILLTKNNPSIEIDILISKKFTNSAVESENLPAPLVNLIKIVQNSFFH